MEVGCSTWLGTCSEINKIGLVDIDRFGRNMIGNKCGYVGHIFIGHANSDLKLEQITKDKFEKNRLDLVFELFEHIVYIDI